MVLPHTLLRHCTVAALDLPADQPVAVSDKRLLVWEAIIRHAALNRRTNQTHAVLTNRQIHGSTLVIAALLESSTHSGQLGVFDLREATQMPAREVLPTFQQFLHPQENRWAKSGNNGQYEPQICAFIDLLGVRQANKADPQVREGLLDLFWSISAVSAPFTENLVEAEPIERYWWGPEISAFSDCFVVSYPPARLEKLHRPGEMNPTENVLDQLLFIIGRVAAACLSHGFILRGAITLGDLYHSDGVILGPALDEAYELERKEAVHPRILVSDAVLGLLPAGHSHSTLRTGEDGRVYLDYMCRMILESAPTDIEIPEFYESANPKNGGATSYCECMRQWLDRAVEIVNLQIQSQAAGRIRDKWIWFGRELEDALCHRMMRGIFEDYRMSDFVGRIKFPSE